MKSKKITYVTWRCSGATGQIWSPHSCCKTAEPSESDADAVGCRIVRPKEPCITQACTMVPPGEYDGYVTSKQKLCTLNAKSTYCNCMTEMHTAGIWDPILDNYPAIWRITINKSWRNVRRQCWIYNSIFIWEQKQMFLWITCSHRTVLGNDWGERNAVRRRRKTGRDGDDCMSDGNELLQRSDGCSVLF